MGKIIIADDQLINIEVLKTQIEELGQLYRCEFCYDGDKTLAKAIEITEQAIQESNKSEETKIKPISLMLLDFQMPKKNGLQVIEAYRNFLKLRLSKIKNLSVIEPHYVFLTAFASKHFKALLESKGFLNVYEKPIQLE